MTSNADQSNGNDRFSQVQVIDRACLIMRTIRDSKGLTLAQLTKQVNLARTTVYRIVSTLINENLLIMEPETGKIQLSLEMVRFGAAVHMDMRHEIHPYLDDLAGTVNENVDFSVLDNDSLFFLDQAVIPHRLNAVASIGKRFPVYCTANGKAVLSVLPRATVEKLLAGPLERLTPYTITMPEMIYAELEQIAYTGVAFDREEYTEGICAVGAPLRTPFFEYAAISIAVPSVRFYGNEDKLVTALKETVQALRYRLS